MKKWLWLVIVLAACNGRGDGNSVTPPAPTLGDWSVSGTIASDGCGLGLVGRSVESRLTLNDPSKSDGARQQDGCGIALAGFLVPAPVDAILTFSYDFAAGVDSVHAVHDLAFVTDMSHALGTRIIVVQHEDGSTCQLRGGVVLTRDSPTCAASPLSLLP